MSLDPQVKELFQAKNFGTVSVRLPSGDIGTTVMWVDADDEHVIFNTEVHRAKYKALEQDPTVTITAWDGENPYHYAEVRGKVVDATTGQPVAFATLTVLGPVEPAGYRASTRVTGRDGRFRLDALVFPDSRLRIEHAGHSGVELVLPGGVLADLGVVALTPAGGSPSPSPRPRPD